MRLWMPCRGRLDTARRTSHTSDQAIKKNSLINLHYFEAILSVQK